MPNISLFQHLENYAPADEYERDMTKRLQNFLLSAKNENPFARDLAGSPPEIGHVTGSAWITSREYSQVVLLHHGKLNIWVQPGGHCDGEENVLSVAMREAEEETGLQSTPATGLIFDIDVHNIPEYWNTPEHLHFDVRYLLIADGNQKPICSNESKAVRWFSLDEALRLSGEESVARMVRKTLHLARDAENRLR